MRYERETARYAAMAEREKEKNRHIEERAVRAARAWWKSGNAEKNIQRYRECASPNQHILCREVRMQNKERERRRKKKKKSQRREKQNGEREKRKSHGEAFQEMRSGMRACPYSVN